MNRKVKPPGFPDLLKQSNRVAAKVMKDYGTALEAELKSRMPPTGQTERPDVLESVQMMNALRWLKEYFLSEGKAIASAGFTLGYVKALDWVEQKIISGEMETIEEVEKIVAVALAPYRGGKRVDSDNRECYQAIDQAISKNKLNKRRLSVEAVIQNVCRADERWRHKKAHFVRSNYDKWVKGGRK
jgi:hypothetical protein